MPTFDWCVARFGHAPHGKCIAAYVNQRGEVVTCGCSCHADDKKEAN